MILVDTSAWIEFDRGINSTVGKRVAELITVGEGIAVTEPVLMEVLIGARNASREADLRELLRNYEFLPFDCVADFDSAIQIYRKCRGAGVTPSGPVDCMIAAVARRFGVTILSHDADLVRIAKVVGLQVDTASIEID
ncbi:MAG: type II toxin-antitoxin system VapC family toxin [Solirubrobacterales bacterium]